MNQKNRTNRIKPAEEQLKHHQPNRRTEPTEQNQKTKPAKKNQLNRIKRTEPLYLN